MSLKTVRTHGSHEALESVAVIRERESECFLHVQSLGTRMCAPVEVDQEVAGSRAGWCDDKSAPNH